MSLSANLMTAVPWQGRVLAILLLTLSTLSAGFYAGVTHESNRRDAQQLKIERQADHNFQHALANGKQRAAEVIEWQRKADIYYRNWQEELNHVPDQQLAECKTGINAPAGVLLSSVWLGLYNAAWLPEIDRQDDSTGAAYALVQAGGVTPREVLENVRTNAKLCAEDRKRHDELIDHLLEPEAAP